MSKTDMKLLFETAVICLVTYAVASVLQADYGAGLMMTLLINLVVRGVQAVPHE